MIPTKSLRNGFTLPVYGTGTWQMGGRIQRDVSNDDARDVEALRAAIDLGVTHIDTAESYANTHTETLVGEAIKGVDRDTLFLASKVSKGHQDKVSLRASFDASCTRLGVDYLDLYMLHQFDSSVPLEETLEVMNDLVDEGRLRNIGVSNFSTSRLRRALDMTKHPIVANQVHYSVTTREIEKDGLLEFCQDRDVMVVSWAPLEKGALTNDAPILREVSDKYNASFVQTALNWLTSQNNVVTLCKTSSVDHLKENLQAFSWQMQPEDIERIRVEMPNQVFRSPRVPLDYD